MENAIDLKDGVFKELMESMGFVQCTTCDCYIKDLKKHSKTKKHLDNINFVDTV